VYRPAQTTLAAITIEAHTVVSTDPDSIDLPWSTRIAAEVSQWMKHTMRWGGGVWGETGTRTLPAVTESTFTASGDNPEATAITACGLTRMANPISASLRHSA